MFRSIIAVALLSCALAGVPRGFNEGRIVGGEETTIEKFPYQAALVFEKFLLCGGSLYSQNIVITAAHCVEGFVPFQIKVRLGSANRLSGGELIPVSALKTHESYGYNKAFDVGVIKLSTPVRLTNKVRPIPLAVEVPKTGTPAYVSGWGVLSYDSGIKPTMLHEVEVEIINRRDCASELYKYGQMIMETMLCAAVADGGKDGCNGDSGGPLAVDGKLVGIVSWGKSCALKDYPGVYASVPELHTWIEQSASELSKE